MLDLLDNLLRHVLMRAPGLGPTAPAGVQAEQVGFQPPDDAWMTAVTNLERNALNVFLIELRENRKLRSNERERNREGEVQPAPARLDCHYLITAWSPSMVTDQIQPVFDEHQLLYQAVAVLLQAHATLNPTRAYGAGSPALNAWPERFRNTDLPIVVGPPEGFGKLAEFWGTMGTKRPWKPALHLVVTLPVALVAEASGPMVMTRITEYRQGDRAETAEVWIQFGGRVLDGRSQAAPAGEVAGAWVRLETTGGEVVQQTRTDERGRFTFANVRPGPYVLRAGAIGLGEVARPGVPGEALEVPSFSGEYDLHFR